MNQRRIITTAIYDSPAGPLRLGEFEGQLCLCDWAEAPRHAWLLARLERSLAATAVSGTTPCLETARGQLDQYFARKLRLFSIPLRLSGTDFRKQVWETLSTVPCGATESYLGMPTVLVLSNHKRALPQTEIIKSAVSKPGSGGTRL